MKFVCANADLVQNINLDTDYDYITASSKSPIMAVETLANSFTKSKSDCVLFVWNTSDPADLVRATEEACVEDVNFKKIIDDLEKNLDYSILGDFDLESIELENGMTISVVKYVTMNNFVESKESATKSMKESINGDCYIYYDDDDGERNVFCDYVKGITDTRSWFYLNEYIIDAIHIFKNEKQAQKFIDEHLKYFADQDKVVIAEYPQTVSGFFESMKSLKESYPNYDVDDVYKELKRLCDKGKNVFSEFYVERDENAFVVSISDDSSYIKLKDFIPYNIHYNKNSFYMYYDNDSTYMTIFANYEDENAINVLVEVVRSLANLKGAYDKCETVSTEIVNQVSNLY